MISVLTICILGLAFPVTMSAYTKYQIVDVDDGPGWTPAAAKWHTLGCIMRIEVLACLAAWVFLPKPPIHILVAILPFSAMVFDISLNLFRKKPIWYTGTSVIDIKLGIAKWAFYAAWLIATLFIIIKFKLK